MPCNSCDSDCSEQRRTHAPGTEQLFRDRVMAFPFPELIERMEDNYGWSKEKAEVVFVDLKQFLYLVGVKDSISLVPPLEIDKMWHEFILHTAVYIAFCEDNFGCYLHHRPHGRGDPPPKGNPVKQTLELAESTFGKLSPHWNYQRALVTDSGCSTDCDG
jgi:hypothetical protein